MQIKGKCHETHSIHIAPVLGFSSRYWGLLPEEYIVGKATRIFRSVNKHTGKERWKRFMKKIE